MASVSMGPTAEEHRVRMAVDTNSLVPGVMASNSSSLVEILPRQWLAHHRLHVDLRSTVSSFVAIEFRSGPEHLFR